LGQGWPNDSENAEFSCTIEAHGTLYWKLVPSTQEETVGMPVTVAFSFPYEVIDPVPTAGPSENVVSDAEYKWEVGVGAKAFCPYHLTYHCCPANWNTDAPDPCEGINVCASIGDTIKVSLDFRATAHTLDPAMQSFSGGPAITMGLALSARAAKQNDANQCKEFMITFDDGPVPGNTENILEALKNIKVGCKPVRAAFFMLGDECHWELGGSCQVLLADLLFFPAKGHVKGNEGLVRKVADEGHFIGVHTQHHPWFDDRECSGAKVEKEIFECYQAISEALAGDPGAANLKMMFRPPYFRYTGNVATVTRKLGFQVVLGAGENEDAAVDVGGRECSTARDLMKSWDKPYPCVLTFHDHLHKTAESIVEAIECLQKDGFTLVNFDPSRIPSPASGEELRHMLSGIAHCAVGLIVTDPQGLVLSEEQSQIPDGMYQEADEDGDGDTESFFFIPEATPGQYSVRVIPEANALPDATYSLEVDVDGQPVVLAQDVLVRDIPQEPYTVVVENASQPTEELEPVAQWTFDEGTGTVAKDSAGTNPGKLYGAKWTDGRIGGALHFDGSGNYVDCGNAAVLAPEKITVAFWMLIEGRTSYQYVLGKTQDMFSQQDYAFSTVGNGKMEFAFGQAAGQRVAVKSKDPLLLGQWMHVAATRDGGTASLYINGQLAGLATYSFAVTNKGQPLRIGAIGSPDTVGFFKGKIDDVRIYDKPLSTEEIQELYRQESP
jgi:peptidoglycan/xylan/chitin deacetylase (PgdA/CDA1 family)